MTDAHPGPEQIAAWVTRGRPATDVAAHMLACADCELVAAGWSTVHGALATWSAALPEPEPLSMPAPRRIDLRTRARQAVAVVSAQVTVVRQQVWAATALVVGVGCLFLIVSQEPAGPLFALFAPMGAACGMALIYGRDVDPAYEISRASPVSMRTVLVARLLVVTAYDIAVAFLGTAVVASVQDAAGLWSLLLTWLGPLLLLSALSVLLSVLFRPWLGIAVSLLLWALRVATLSPAHAMVLAVGVRWMWTTSPVVLATALVVTALAVFAVGGREERTV